MTLRFLQEEPIEAIIKNIDRIHTWVILSPSYLLFINFFYSGRRSWPQRHWRPNSSFLSRFSGWNRDCSAPYGSGSRYNTQRYGATLGSACSYWEHKYHGCLNEGTYVTTLLVQFVFHWSIFLNITRKITYELIFCHYKYTLKKYIQASVSHVHNSFRAKNWSWLGEISLHLCSTFQVHEHSSRRQSVAFFIVIDSGIFIKPIKIMKYSQSFSPCPNYVLALTRKTLKTLALW